MYQNCEAVISLSENVILSSRNHTLKLPYILASYACAPELHPFLIWRIDDALSTQDCVASSDSLIGG
jgi:hypothetical protein